MTLLSLINASLLDTNPHTPIVAVLKSIKRRAYEIQVEHGHGVEVALNMACAEQHVSLSNVQGKETFVQTLDRKALADYVGVALLKKQKLLNDNQIRNLLKPYAHLSDKEKVATLVRRYRGRVNPEDVQRIVKERHHF